MHGLCRYLWLVQCNYENFSSLNKPTAWRQVASLFFLPAIGLYMLAYRLLGLRHTYRLGNFDVTPLEQVSEGQFLFTRLFPVIVALLVITIVWGIAYSLGIPIN